MNEMGVKGGDFAESSIVSDPIMNDAEDQLETQHPLYQSPRLKGYITLLSSSVYNYISADNQTLTVEYQPVDWCMAQYDLSLLTEDPRPNISRIRYAMTAAVITIMITCAVIFAHVISITGLGNALCAKVCTIL